MNLRFLGSILLVAGTSIGAGLLALPLATASSGFENTLLTLLACWLLMTFGAFYIVEVTLKLPPNNNLITMAKTTLGRAGEAITWVIYLLLLYALLSAYIAGGSDLTHQLLTILFTHSENAFDTLIFAFVVGAIVIKGVKSVDWANRGLMTAKILTFLLLLLLIIPHLHTHYLEKGRATQIPQAIMVVITSFGFAIVVPSLRNYLNNDGKLLRLAVLIGSLIALLCYAFWCLTIQGNIALNTLSNISTSKNVISGLTSTLSQHLHTRSVHFFVHFFASISILTSFLAVALSLSDFLSDGLKREKTGKSGLIIYGLTFLPPVMIVIFFPGAFISALRYAGIFCILLLILLPALMAWRLRQAKPGGYELFGGNKLIALTTLAGLILLTLGIVNL